MSIYWLGRDSHATLASPQSEQSSELDRPTAVRVACGFIARTPFARSAPPGICGIIPSYSERSTTGSSISNPRGLCEAGGHLGSRFHEYSAQALSWPANSYWLHFKEYLWISHEAGMEYD